MTSSRKGFTLIELIASMIAASVLLASLAGTILVSGHLLESHSQRDIQPRDLEMVDRISSDLRYANQIDETAGNSFSITKPAVLASTDDTIQYESGTSGLTRQLNAGEAYPLAAQTATLNFDTHDYTAPTTAKLVRVRSSSSAVNTSGATSLTIEYPAGCQNGDLLVMAISARSPNSVAIAPSQWTLLNFIGTGNLRLLVAFRLYDNNLNDLTTVTFTDGSAVAAATMVAIENASLTSSANWVGYDAGFALDILPATHPEPLEPTSGTLSQHLNFQIFAANNDPWFDFGETLGLASYTDVVKETAFTNSIAIAVRNGPAPSLPYTPRTWQQTSGRWLQAGMRIGGSQ
jgi:prepilin-type N-terminal cleavage/methylation domain-containing protein